MGDRSTATRHINRKMPEGFLPIGRVGAGLALALALGTSAMVGTAPAQATAGGTPHGGMPPAGVPSGTLNLVDIGTWSAGIPGFATSAGTLGWIGDLAASPSGPSGSLVGIASTSNQFGPANFNVGVVKGASFNTSTKPSGGKPPNGKPHNGNPHTGKPPSGKPHTGNPPSGKPHNSNSG